MVINQDIDVRGKSGIDVASAQVEVDFGHEVTGTGSIQRSLERDAGDVTVEDLVPIGIDSDLRLLGAEHPCYVAFRDSGIKVHAGEVGDGENDGCGIVHGADHHQLADFGVQGRDHPVHGRANLGSTQRLVGT